MAFWKDPNVRDGARDGIKDALARDTSKEAPKDTLAKEFPLTPPPAAEGEKVLKVVASGGKETSTPARAPAPVAKESFIAADLVIEGKIEGAGHVRIAGRFKGDVQVQGNVTVESGALVTGEVRADTVVIGGQVTGNVHAASRVELQSTGVLNGDLHAGSLVVSAGSRMRGQVEFGWNDK